MDHIIIRELEVFYRVGVPEWERATPQRLLLNLDLEADLAEAAASDDLSQTIDYFAVTRHLLAFGHDRSWQLIEKLAVDIAEVMLSVYHARTVEVEVRKFVIPETRYVAVRITRSRKGL
jgi:7,8-dihydroneopterin aldolase/epimerase/oxygenase